jgi:hypothetical protein
MALQESRKYDLTGITTVYIITLQDAVIHPDFPPRQRHDVRLFYFSSEMTYILGKYGLPSQESGNEALNEHYKKYFAVNIFLPVTKNNKMFEYLGKYVLFKTDTPMTRGEWNRLDHEVRC